jgi:two-component system response regulator
MHLDTRPILLVEDNPDDIELTLHALKDNSIANEVIVARDGSEAVEMLFGGDKSKAKDERLRPSIVLLDLKLPGLSGFDVLRRIREEQSTMFIPVVILTSSKEQLDLMNGYKLGANSYVRKPVDFEEFLTVVQQLGSYWLTVNEPIA